jgi:hypothetical protein
MLSSSLFHSMGSFSSQVTWILVLSIVVPHVTSSAAIAINHPTLVLGWRGYTRKNIDHLNVLKLLLFMFGVFVPAILIYLKEVAKDKKKEMLKKTTKNFILQGPEQQKLSKENQEGESRKAGYHECGSLHM